MIELEKTYLAKYLPEGLTKSPSKELIDIYIPRERVHPLLRLRKNGDKYEITKKVKVSENDASRQIEHTIPLDNEEFSAFSMVDGKKIRKTRYYYPFNGQTAEIDVFQDRLSG